MKNKEFSYEDFCVLDKKVREKIICETIQRARTNESCHAIDDLVRKNRCLAIAARMTSRPIQWNVKYIDGNGEIVKSGEIKAYTGDDIANIFVKSVQKNGYCYYPITGDWTNTQMKQLIIFVKREEGYIPYARFDIEDKEKNEKLTKKHLDTLVDPTPALYCSHKTVLKITNVQIEDLPENYIGLRSGEDIYKVAFKGSAPNVMVI